MPNKETAEILTIMPSDSRFFEVALIQQMIADAVAMQMAQVEQPLAQAQIETMALVKVEEASGGSDKSGVWPTNRSDAEWDELFQQTAFSDEYAWVESLFAKELVFREFFRERKV